MASSVSLRGKKFSLSILCQGRRDKSAPVTHIRVFRALFPLSVYGEIDLEWDAGVRRRRKFRQDSP